jgi:hypothetical protein
MSEFVGDTFEDYGNALECPEPTIPAYEVLGRGWARIFVCKTVAGRTILDHTDILSRETMYALAARLRDIADSLDSKNEIPTARITAMICHKGH